MRFEELGGDIVGGHATGPHYQVLHLLVLLDVLRQMPRVLMRGGRMGGLMGGEEWGLVELVGGMG